MWCYHALEAKNDASAPWLNPEAVLKLGSVKARAATGSISAHRKRTASFKPVVGQKQKARSDLTRNAGRGPRRDK